MSLLPLLLLMGSAQAGEPVLRVDGDRVVVDVTVQAPLERVLPLMHQPREIARIDGGGTEVTVLASGACDELAYSVPSFVGRVEYVVSFCARPDGSTANLLRSEDMASYQAIWKATDTGQGVAIHYEILAQPTMRVPRRLVLGATKRQVLRLIERMVREVEGG